MQRIKLDVFKSWFDKNLTGKEIDFLLVLSFYQDKRGITRGVYYKDMMREGKMSAQTFYDCKRSLTEKGVISSIEGQDDYDITLIGNDFTIYGKEDYEEGKVKYLSTTYHLFRDPYFRTLKPNKVTCNGSAQYSDGGQTERCKYIPDLPEKFYKKICKYKTER